MATTNCAASESALTHSFIGLPAKRFQSPVPFGAFTTVPSKTKISSGISPETQSSRSFLHVVSELQPKRGMPEHVDAEIGDEIAGAGFLGVQERHGVAGTRSALEPKQIGHSFLPVRPASGCGLFDWSNSSKEGASVVALLDSLINQTLIGDT